MCLLDAERGENSVTGELLHDSAVHRDAARDGVEVLGDPAAHDLGVGTEDEARRVDEVHEEHGRELAFHR